jgi:hypothetical protein
MNRTDQHDQHSFTEHAPARFATKGGRNS